jgi:hypothetical protein
MNEQYKIALLRIGSQHPAWSANPGDPLVRTFNAMAVTAREAVAAKGADDDEKADWCEKQLELIAAPIVALPCPFCSVVGRQGPDGAYYFSHAETCWIGLQQGRMLDCVSYAEIGKWNARSSLAIIGRVSG